MKTSVNLYDFREAFARIDRTNFSYEGLAILFDYLEQYEEDTGEKIELDVIALCCDFAEDTFAEVAEKYGIELSDCDSEDEEEKAEQVKDAVLEYLNNNTSVVGEVGDDSVIYQQF